MRAALSSKRRRKFLASKIDASTLDLTERVVAINRVSKTVKGGRISSSPPLLWWVTVKAQSALVWVNRARFPMPSARASRMPEKSREDFSSRNHHTSRNHRRVRRRQSSAQARSPRYRVIAGGPVRAVVETAGIKDIRAKALRSNNACNVVRATMQGLTALRDAEQVAAVRGKTVQEILG